MARISIVESRTQRRLILDGKLIAPWIAELRDACQRAKAGLQDRELVVELRNLILISQEGENLLLDLMKEGVTFRCSGGFAKLVLSRLLRSMPKAFRRRDDIGQEGPVGETTAEALEFRIKGDGPRYV